MFCYFAKPPRPYPSTVVWSVQVDGAMTLGTLDLMASDLRGFISKVTCIQIDWQSPDRDTLVLLAVRVKKVWEKRENEREETDRQTDR